MSGWVADGQARRVLDQRIAIRHQMTRHDCRRNQRLYPPPPAARPARRRHVSDDETTAFLSSTGRPAVRCGAARRDGAARGYCSLAAWYCSSATGSSHLVPSPPGDALEHGEVAPEVGGGCAVPVCRWGARG